MKSWDFEKINRKIEEKRKKLEDSLIKKKQKILEKLIGKEIKVSYDFPVGGTVGNLPSKMNGILKEVSNHIRLGAPNERKCRRINITRINNILINN